jgi:hypothetical protein
MGNIETYYFRQYAFGEEGKYRQGKYVLVPSEEEPRTPHRGHSLLLNMKHMVRDDETYYLYHKSYQEIRDQGGLVGYAHKGRGFSAERGMALDMPFGLIDFIEILQANTIGGSVYYEFLNLGYKLAPTAGSDYPYIDPPGLVRNYVKLEGPYSDQAWFDALDAGRTYVTCGPVVNFTVNNVAIGGEFQVTKGDDLTIDASAIVNPTLGKLRKLQLIVHGKVVATAEPEQGKDSIKLSHKMAAERSMWMVVKVMGSNHLLAHTAPIYVIVDGGRHWKRSAVPELVTRQRQRLKDLLKKPVQGHAEIWLNDTLKRKWAEQKALIAERVKLANAKYDELLKQFQSEK